MKALVIVDMQNDFMPGGPLGVPGADAIPLLLNTLIPRFSLVVATKDWHPPDHASFAANHVGKKVGEVVDVKGVPQILWPVHCVRNTLGAEFVSTLNPASIESIFYKGTDRWIDSYSAFFDNAHRKATGLEEFLKSRGVDQITIAGVATDYCVLYSTLDALNLGFKVEVVADACRGINLQAGDVEKAFETMRRKGAEVIQSKDLKNSKGQEVGH